MISSADQATDHGGLEGYARKMYRQVVRMKLPIYVIDPPIGDGPLTSRVTGRHPENLAEPRTVPTVTSGRV